ncbi:MAG: TraB/GumN family protein [Pseudomonadota bacterium]|nr:TraB/GumN family protein [Pseudomonadota bacterium]
MGHASSVACACNPWWCRAVVVLALLVAMLPADAAWHFPVAQDPLQPDAGTQVVTAPAPIVASDPEQVARDAAADPAAGSVRGVLFQVHPPLRTMLPAELAVVGQPAMQDGAHVESVPEAKDREAPAAPVMPGPTPAAAEPLPSYLLGTIHFGTPEEQGIDYGVLEKTLANVETFVNEANIDAPWNPDYDDFRWLAPTQPLSSLLSKEGFASARLLLPNIRRQDLLRMKPWSVLALLEARAETGGDATMDARLQRVASAAGKRLVHLETLEQQLRALDCVPATEHAQVLDERLRAPSILRDESAAAMRHYRSRNLEAWLADIDQMQGLSIAAKAVEQRSRLCLLEERNARWIGQLETLFQDGPAFVAVGAVHLVGAEGLIALLRRNGYRIEEVPL